MQIPLTPEHERLVRDLVDGERYLTPGEVVRDALHLLEERERLRAMREEDLRREIQKSFDSGPATPLDFTELKAKARAMLERERNPSP
jgi:antitoxin ParD1/3/4